MLLRCDLLAKKVPGRAPYSQHIPCDDLHIMHATNSWLQPGKVNTALGTLLTLFESCLWMSGLPLTLICSLDPRRPIKATQTSNKRGHRLLMGIRHKIISFPHRKKFFDLASADVTNQETLWHCVVALLLSPAVECMFSSGPKMHWSVALLQITRN